MCSCNYYILCENDSIIFLELFYLWYLEYKKKNLYILLNKIGWKHTKKSVLESSENFWSHCTLAQPGAYLNSVGTATRGPLLTMTQVRQHCLPSTYIHDNGLDYKNFKWSVHKKASPRHKGAKFCDVCLSEKLAISKEINRPECLNRRREFGCKCPHRFRHLLAAVKGQ